MKVSIIMATHNRGDLIENAIKSVMNQTYENWELIVVADGCTDDTNAIVSGYVQGDERIYHHPVDKMEYYTHVRNYGIDHSDGELIAFRDDDGAWHPEFLEEAVKRHENPNVLVTYCGRRQFVGIDFGSLDITEIEQLPGQDMEIPAFVGSNSLTNLIDVGDIVIKRSVFNGEFTGFSKEKDRPGYCSDALLLDEILRVNRWGQFVAIPRHLHYYFLDHGAKLQNMTIRKLQHRNENDGQLGSEEEDWSF